jgi:hypothetical protein
MVCVEQHGDEPRLGQGTTYVEDESDECTGAYGNGPAECGVVPRATVG